MRLFPYQNDFCVFLVHIIIYESFWLWKLKLVIQNVKESLIIPLNGQFWKKKHLYLPIVKSMGVGPFAYFDQGSFASLNDKI